MHPLRIATMIVHLAFSLALLLYGLAGVSSVSACGVACFSIPTLVLLSVRL